MNLTIIPALALGLLAQVTINLYDPKSRDAGYVRVNPRPATSTSTTRAANASGTARSRARATSSSSTQTASVC